MIFVLEENGKTVLTMAEYIEREALISICEQIISDDWNRRTAPESWADAYECFMEEVKDHPAADVVEVRHGKWIEDHEFFKCSECGYLTDYRLSKFCPDCGAKMDGKVGADND